MNQVKYWNLHTVIIKAKRGILPISSVDVYMLYRASILLKHSVITFSTTEFDCLVLDIMNYNYSAANIMENYTSFSKASHQRVS